MHAGSQLKMYFPLIFSTPNFQYTCSLKLFKKIYKTSRYIKIKYKSAITFRARAFTFGKYIRNIHRSLLLFPRIYFFHEKGSYMGAIPYHKNARSPQSYFSIFEKMNFADARAYKLHLLTQYSRSKIFGHFSPMSVELLLIFTSL